MNRRKLLTAGVSTIVLSRMAKAIETKSLQSQNVKLIGGAAKIPDRDSSSTSQYIPRWILIGANLSF
jgi:hypothetical protein